MIGSIVEAVLVVSVVELAVVSVGVVLVVAVVSAGAEVPELPVVVFSCDNAIDEKKTGELRMDINKTEITNSAFIFRIYKFCFSL